MRLRACSAARRPEELYITDLLAGGADIFVVQQLAGHSDPKTTRRYDLGGEEAKRTASRKLSFGTVGTSAIRNEHLLNPIITRLSFFFYVFCWNARFVETHEQLVIEWRHLMRLGVTCTTIESLATMCADCC